jgi:hypothetical protein
MSWRAITESDLAGAISGVELAAIRAAALEAGGTDPVATMITMVTNLVRGYVARAATLGATGVPEELISPAADIIAYKLFSRIGREPSNARKQLHDDAMALLKSVASGEFVIAAPSTATSETMQVSHPSFPTPDRQFTTDSEDGI